MILHFQVYRFRPVHVSSISRYVYFRASNHPPILPSIKSNPTVSFSGDVSVWKRWPMEGGGVSASTDGRPRRFPRGGELFHRHFGLRQGLRERDRAVPAEGDEGQPGRP